MQSINSPPFPVPWLAPSPIHCSFLIRVSCFWLCLLRWLLLLRKSWVLSSAQLSDLVPSNIFLLISLHFIPSDCWISEPTSWGNMPMFLFFLTVMSSSNFFSLLNSYSDSKTELRHTFLQEAFSRNLSLLKELMIASPNLREPLSFDHILIVALLDSELPEDRNNFLFARI